MSKLRAFLKTLPREIRPYIEQEYYINEDEALKMAGACKTYADVQAYRRERSKTFYPLLKSSFGEVCDIGADIEFKRTIRKQSFNQFAES